MLFKMEVSSQYVDIAPPVLAELLVNVELSIVPSPFKNIAPAYSPIFSRNLEFLIMTSFSFVIAPPYPMAMFFWKVFRGLGRRSL